MTINLPYKFINVDKGIELQKTDGLPKSLIMEFGMALAEHNRIYVSSNSEFYDSHEIVIVDFERIVALTIQASEKLDAFIQDESNFDEDGVITISQSFLSDVAAILGCDTNSYKIAELFGMAMRTALSETILMTTGKRVTSNENATKLVTSYNSLVSHSEEYLNSLNAFFKKIESKAK